MFKVGGVVGNQVKMGLLLSLTVDYMDGLCCATAGSTLGEILSPVITGLLSDSLLLGGWPAAFYLFGNKSTRCRYLDYLYSG